MLATHWPATPHPATTGEARDRPPTASADGWVVAVRGVHGGAGTTTVAAHLAAAWARWGPGPVGLVDLAGGLAHRLDLPAGVRAWTDLTAVAGGPDADRLRRGLTEVLAEPWPGLHVLPLAGLVDGSPEPAPDPALVEAALGAGRLAWRLVVVDLPPAGARQVDVALGAAEVLVAVGRCQSAGIQGVRAALDGWSLAGGDEGLAGAVITAAQSRAPLAPREARAALGERLWALIPADTLELAAAAEDGMLLLDRPDLPAVQAMIALANRIVPFPAQTG